MSRSEDRDRRPSVAVGRCVVGLVVAAVVVVACGSGAATTSPSAAASAVTPTPAATPAPTPSPTGPPPTATPTPTDSQPPASVIAMPPSSAVAPPPTAAPSTVAQPTPFVTDMPRSMPPTVVELTFPPTAAPGSSASPSAEPALPATALQAWVGDGPNKLEAQILSHVPGSLFERCEPVGKTWFYATENVLCRIGDVSITYGLFESKDTMQPAYDQDVSQMNPQPIPGSECSSGAFEAGYSIAKVHVGRWLCTDRVVGLTPFHIIEWTNERLNLITYLAGPNMEWPALIDLSNTVGPIG